MYYCRLKVYEVGEYQSMSLVIIALRVYYRYHVTTGVDLCIIGIDVYIIVAVASLLMFSRFLQISRSSIRRPGNTISISLLAESYLCTISQQLRTRRIPLIYNIIYIYKQHTYLSPPSNVICQHVDAVKDRRNGKNTYCSGPFNIII